MEICQVHVCSAAEASSLKPPATHAPHLTWVLGGTGRLADLKLEGGLRGHCGEIDPLGCSIARVSTDLGVAKDSLVLTAARFMSPDFRVRCVRD